MIRSILSRTILMITFVSFANISYGWNKAGHMVSGAIAFADLKRQSPDALRKVIEVLQEHPEYDTRWQPILNAVPSENRDLYLFMLAARWPDDVRGDASQHRDTWHFINYPFKPMGQPSSVMTRDPRPVNIVTAQSDNLAVLHSNATSAEKAVALCWLFHLYGDVHQPLHTVALFTTQFPNGDRGGTRFYVRARTGSTTLSLHEFWDGLIQGSQRFQSVSNRATELRSRPAHQRAALSELSETRFESWAKSESFDLAREHAYRNGHLNGSTDEDDGKVLPNDYADKAKSLAERRVVLSGYRLADTLKRLFD